MPTRARSACTCRVRYLCRRRRSSSAPVAGRTPFNDDRRAAASAPMTAKRPLADIGAEAAALLSSLNGVRPATGAEELLRLRHKYLTRQVQALRARVGMLQGTKLTFDEESKALYDAVPPVHMDAEFEKVLAELDKRLPGEGSAVDRYNAFRNRFIIPTEKLDAVFKAAIAGCRS